MAKPASRQDLQDWCLRRLGAPVINVEVASEQLDDRVDEALEVFTEHHYDGTIEEWVAYTITQQDVDNGYIEIPDDILAVVELVPAAELFTRSGMFSFQYQVALEQLSPWQAFSNIDYVMKITSFEETLNLTSVTPTFKYQRHGNKLKVHYQFHEGYQLAVRVFRALDPDTYTSIWNDRWLKDYTTALIKRQWGENTKKFSNIQLLGGVTINGEQLFQEALQDIEKLETQLREEFSEPIDFFVG